jgi:hypothetical protein
MRLGGCTSHQKAASQGGFLLSGFPISFRRRIGHRCEVVPATHALTELKFSLQTAVDGCTLRNEWPRSGRQRGPSTGMPSLGLFCHMTALDSFGSWLRFAGRMPDACRRAAGVIVHRRLVNTDGVDKRGNEHPFAVPHMEWRGGRSRLRTLLATTGRAELGLCGYLDASAPVQTPRSADSRTHDQTTLLADRKRSARCLCRSPDDEVPGSRHCGDWRAAVKVQS